MYTEKESKEMLDYSHGVAVEIVEAVENDTLDEWLNELVLEAHRITDYHGRLVGVKLLRTCGGPHCWIDTYDGKVYSVSYGSGVQSVGITRSACEAINAFFDF